MSDSQGPSARGVSDERTRPKQTTQVGGMVEIEHGYDFVNGYRVTVGWSDEDESWLARLSGMTAVSPSGVLADGPTQMMALAELACALANIIDGEDAVTPSTASNEPSEPARCAHCGEPRFKHYGKGEFCDPEMRFGDRKWHPAPSDARAPEGTEPTCNKVAASLNPRLGMAYACVLAAGHNGECAPGGTCFTHGPYIGKPGTTPVCPKCPEPSLPPEPSRALGEQTMTREQGRKIAADYQRTLDEYAPGILRRVSAERYQRLWNLLSNAYASLAFRYGEIIALEEKNARLAAALTEAEAKRTITLRWLSEVERKRDLSVTELRTALSTKDAEIARLTEGYAYLFEEIGFPLRHRWGGDTREFTEGVLAAVRAATPPSEPDHAR